MINISAWMDEFIAVLDRTFGERVWFVGLQGSYARAEATETSDIDPVVILDEVNISDVRKYNDMLDTLPGRELICGFFSGRKEILNWDAADLFQFYYDTKPIKGSLDELLNIIDENAVRRAIRIGAGNIYHGCVHNILIDKSEDIIRGLYKSASFVVQAIYFIESGKYLSRMDELKGVVSSEEKEIIDIFTHLKNGGDVEYERMSEVIFKWSINLLAKK